MSTAKTKKDVNYDFKYFIKTLPRAIVNVFTGWNILWHITLIALTAAIVLSGLDWWYFVHTINIKPALYYPAVILGALLPILVPIILLIAGQIKRNGKLKQTGFMLGQAAILGSLISSTYKAFTGRLPPVIGGDTSVDLSHGFNFGFWEHGIFWGWPSSHTTIAFAMVLALITLYPKNKIIKICGLLYAFYIGLSVSVSIHWLSEFIAGAILGTVIGIVVGKIFKDKIHR